MQALCEAKNHALVLKDAALEMAASRVINSGFGCAGQRCMALPVICVEDRTHGGMVGVNVGIPVPLSVFPFAGHKKSFFGDLHAMGKDGVAFFTEAKCVTIQWFNEEDMKHTKLDTWEGTMTR